MRISPLLIITVFVILLIGWVIYLEIGNKNFVDNLPQAPTEEQNVHNSSKVQHLSPTTTPSDEQTVTKLITSKPPDQQSEKEQTDNEVRQEAPDNYDWRKDKESVSDLADRQLDPWRKRESFGETEDRTTLITNPQEMAPDALWDATHNQLIEKFGDIPQVHLFTEMNRKLAKKNPVTLDERIAGIEAALHLFPREGTRRHLEALLKIREDVRAGKREAPVWIYNAEPRVRVR